MTERIERKGWARAQAKALKGFLATEGINVTQGLCLEAIAVINGVRNWQTFEASEDADVVVNDPNALHRVAQIALEAALFKALPEGKTLNTLCQELTDVLGESEASIAEGREEWRKMKHRVNQAMEGVEERDFMVPPVRLPCVVDEALTAIASALRERIGDRRPVPHNEAPLVYERRMRDWRLVEGEEVPVTDARTYQLKVSSSDYGTFVNIAYPHAEPDALPEGSPQLAVMFEINNGLPCVHLYGDIYCGEALLTVFAARGNELVGRFSCPPESAATHALKAKLGLDMTSVRLS